MAFLTIGYTIDASVIDRDMGVMTSEFSSFYLDDVQFETCYVDLSWLCLMQNVILIQL